MKSFRGIMAGTLIIEVIVVALAIPVVARLGGGIGTTGGVLVFVLLGCLLVTCGLLRFSWSVQVILGIQVLMIVGGFAMTALAVIGVLFALVWVCLLLMRRDVAKRMAEGRLPSQQ
ncbi:DUF4233 domain-containing protein [Solihabitans fulvus]|uniref:DUF4233 domain-containing protein n=2 Tax=Solihabitans fulvus TaxID=1892852 RepID=A0A5B2XS32_9PSEU|nr:DUF4233 domain-containing protein [Solihabitans fulvus]